MQFGIITNDREIQPTAVSVLFFTHPHAGCKFAQLHLTKDPKVSVAALPGASVYMGT